MTAPSPEANFLRKAHRLDEHLEWFLATGELLAWAVQRGWPTATARERLLDAYRELGFAELAYRRDLARYELALHEFCLARMNRKEPSSV